MFECHTLFAVIAYKKLQISTCIGHKQYIFWIYVCFFVVFFFRKNCLVHEIVGLFQFNTWNLRHVPLSDCQVHKSYLTAILSTFCKLSITSHFCRLCHRPLPTVHIIVLLQTKLPGEAWRCKIERNFKKREMGLNASKKNITHQVFC